MKKILIVDDEADITFFLKRAFSNEIVKEVGLLADALSVTRDFTPNVIILDINLPDGVSLNSIGRFMELSPSSKIILISAANDYLESDYKDYGAVGFFKKPFSTASIKELVESLYNNPENQWQAS